MPVSANEIAHPPRTPAGYKNMAKQSRAEQIFKEMHIAQPYLWLISKLQIIYKMFTWGNWMQRTKGGGLG